MKKPVARTGFHCRLKPGAGYLTALAMYSTVARISASDAWVPPRGGMAPLPAMAIRVMPSIPSFRRSAQAALSPNLGAPATPAAWHTWQACL